MVCHPLFPFYVISHDCLKLCFAPFGIICFLEPGYYKDEGFGIRIESVVVVKEIKRLSPEPPNENNTKPFLGFENLTMCPIQTKLLDLSLLNQNQIEWINSYHQLGMSLYLIYEVSKHKKKMNLGLTSFFFPRPAGVGLQSYA
jgi:hypothetical protein